MCWVETDSVNCLGKYGESSPLCENLPSRCVAVTVDGVERLGCSPPATQWNLTAESWDAEIRQALEADEGSAGLRYKWVECGREYKQV